MKAAEKVLKISKKYLKTVGNSTTGSLVFIEASEGILKGLTNSIDFSTKHPLDASYVLLKAKIEMV